MRVCALVDYSVALWIFFFLHPISEFRFLQLRICISAWDNWVGSQQQDKKTVAVPYPHLWITAGHSRVQLEQ